MNLENEWSNLGTALATQHEAYGTTLRKESTGLVEKLIHTLKIKMLWIRIINVPILISALWAEKEMKYVLLAIFLAYEGARALSLRKIKQMASKIDYTAVTSSLLQHQLDLIQQVLQIERIWGFLFIPIATPAGYIASQLLWKRNLSSVLQDTTILWVVLAGIVIAIPAWYLTKVMNKVAVGDDIKSLSEKIAQLQGG